MASHQPRNDRYPQHEQAASPTSSSSSSSDCKPEPLRYLAVVPLYASNEPGSQGPKIPDYGMEYAFFMKSYQMIEKHFGHLPEFRDISQRFQHKVRMAPHGRVTWVSFFRPGQECSYFDALKELTDILGRLKHIPDDEMSEIIRLAHGVINHRKTFEPLDHSHRLILDKWERVADFLCGLEALNKQSC